MRVGSFPLGGTTSFHVPQEGKRERTVKPGRTAVPDGGTGGRAQSGCSHWDCVHQPRPVPASALSFVPASQSGPVRGKQISPCPVPSDALLMGIEGTGLSSPLSMK